MGRSSKPDTSSYDRQLADQKEAAQIAEAEAARLKEKQDAADARRLQGRASLLATGVSGDESMTSVKRKSLLGG